MPLMLAGRLDGDVMPPAVGNPSFSRVARQVLYFVSGKRWLTSSMVINFFSLRRRCGRGMTVKSMFSPLAAARSARLRWL
jgi:hypothetical protein